ncbi:MAG: hypothetical protein KAR08_04070 [Candidatus Heimdallarchaeota archaeon]|nr:hypothetical protein [Candidatus Heimdallarchaeota archaeon]
MMLGSPITDAWFWFYFVNAVLLIIHEIDSAYWKEWELFKLRGGITGFLIIHFPLIGAILFGLIAITQWYVVGLIFSFILCVGGLFAFTIHTYFLKKGKEEFNSLISIAILIAILVVSVIQLALTFLVIFV